MIRVNGEKREKFSTSLILNNKITKNIIISLNNTTNTTTIIIEKNWIYQYTYLYSCSGSSCSSRLSHYIYYD